MESKHASTDSARAGSHRSKHAPLIDHNGHPNRIESAEINRPKA
jgi:hypothetical protein